MAPPLLKTISLKDLSMKKTEPVDRKTLEIAKQIVEDVRDGEESALRDHAFRLGDINRIDEPLACDREELASVLDACGDDEKALLERTASRIESFALAQKESIRTFEMPVPGGLAGQVITPVDRAGCYAPGGRFPLPSSVLMTAVTARAAGVDEVWLASPRPSRITMAAAAVAKVDGLLKVGGAQAIAAMAFGVGPVPACDVIAGPGNRFVTAAKQLVFGRVGIDMLAGPSELTVLADDTADPSVVAADLLAQAEHDPDAIPALVTTSAALIEKVNRELGLQLSVLPTKETAGAALQNGFAVLVPTLETGIETCDLLAPEHLEIQVADALDVANRCSHYGAIFIGQGSAEVLGDYGAGPNHTLPTGGTARYAGGLSVFNFLRIRTSLRMESMGASPELASDSAAMARLEGLEAHARSAEKRIK